MYNVTMDRFWNKVNKTDTCWLWTASKFKNKGYGQFGFNGKNTQAHRVAWTITYGEIPKGMYVCHSCDNQSCVRPEHLFLGTPKDNVQDCINKKRRANNTGKHVNANKTHCPKEHEYSKKNTYWSVYKNRKYRHCKVCTLTNRAKRKMTTLAGSHKETDSISL